MSRMLVLCPFEPNARDARLIDNCCTRSIVPAKTGTILGIAAPKPVACIARDRCALRMIKNSRWTIGTNCLGIHHGCCNLVLSALILLLPAQIQMVLTASRICISGYMAHLLIRTNVNVDPTNVGPSDKTCRERGALTIGPLVSCISQCLFVVALGQMHRAEALQS